MFPERVVPDLLSSGWTLPLIGLILVSALGYTLATIGMKQAALGLPLLALPLLLVGFMAATVAEVILLRKVDLAVVYVTIIGVETLLVLSYAAFIGEGLNLRGLLGAGLVVTGLALVSH